MLVPGPTHSGSPFAGRSREIGVATHLLQEGLAGGIGLLRIAGPTGVGRRRFIAETLHRGPDAEWIHLAPGGVEADIRRWIRTELHDLLDSYPEAPVPSWALHVLAQESPALAARAALPAASFEHLSSRDHPAVFGRSIGAVLHALTGETLVVVDAGLWPRPGPARRTLEALARSLRGAGALMITASDPPGLHVDRPGERTLLLEPLDVESLRELARAWGLADRADAVAGWLHRMTGGHPQFLHETVRWLEETGHVLVQEEERRVDFLDPLDRLPIPLNLPSILELRYRRLPPEAARLLALIAHHDGEEDAEALRERWNDDDSFLQGLAWLRRREFLLRRTTRRPLALASPLWHSLVRGVPLRFPVPDPDFEVPAAPESALAQVARGLESAALAGEEDPRARSRELARLARRAHGRPGPAWEGMRGRIAVLAARLRLTERSPRRALAWVRQGRAALDVEFHPALRRSLAAVGARVQEQLQLPLDAQTLREESLAEAILAGHGLAATRLEAVVAEGARRLGRFEAAREGADRAEAMGEERGLPGIRHLAQFTAIAALLDARELDRAEAALARAPFAAGARGLAARLERLRTKPGIPESHLVPPASVPRGWGWGLDTDNTWRGGWRRLDARRLPGHDVAIRDRDLEKEFRRAADTGCLGLAADLAEARLLAALRSGRGRRRGPLPLEDPVRILGRLGAETRLGALAELLRGMPRAAEDSRFPDLYGPYLLRAVPETAPVPQASLRFVTTGRLRVVHGGRDWPRSLWPDWWVAVWGEAVSAEVCGASLSRAEAEQVLAAAADRPAGELETVLNQGNQLLRGPERVAAGLVARGGIVVLEPDGMGVDAIEIAKALRAASEAPGTARARASCRHALDLCEGVYLPGVETPWAVRARAWLREEMLGALRVCLEGPDPVDPASLVAWLEGPVRMLGGAGAAAVAGFMKRTGRPRRARALEPASP